MSLGKITAVLSAFALVPSVADRGSDACLDCATSTCVLLPPDGSSFPCYEGSLADANKCFDTDPLLADGTTYECSTCDSEGYGTYLMNDPIYKNMALWAKSSKVKAARTDDDESCLDCADDVCALIPPSGSSFPCYQGSDKDANFCLHTDPLLAEGTTFACSTCADAGYSTYLQNDPIYKNMELWSMSSRPAERVGGGACDECSDDLCSILPPAGSKFPCYEGTVADTNKCFATDPLLKANSTTSCNSCMSAGYESYLQNDPIYKNMALWGP